LTDVATVVESLRCGGANVTVLGRTEIGFGDR
jgi:hypothetical protein